MIHSGSRGLGYQVCDESSPRSPRSAASSATDYAACPIRSSPARPSRSARGRRYLGAMQAAANFAWANRQVHDRPRRARAARTRSGSRSASSARASLYDVCHNVAKLEEHEVDGGRASAARPPQGRDPRLRAGRPARRRRPTASRPAGLIPGDMGPLLVRARRDRARDGATPSAAPATARAGSSRAARRCGAAAGAPSRRSSPRAASRSSRAGRRRSPRR